MSWIRRHVARRLADEGGLTLIEIVIAVSILGIIIGPITTSFMLGILESTSTRDRVADSSGAQLLSAFLPSDIESSQLVKLNPSTPPACASGLPAGVTAVSTPLQLSWTDLAFTSTVDEAATISYVKAQNSHLQYELYRCTGVAAPLQLVQDVSSDPDAIVVTCTPSPCTDYPDVVKVSLTMKSIDPSSASSYSALTIDISAKRRVSQ